MSAVTAHPITRYGAAILYRPRASASPLDTAVQALVEGMFPSMYAAKDVRLAADQIGAGLRVFVYDCPDASGENQAGHVVNPVLAAPRAFARPVTDSAGVLLGGPVCRGITAPAALRSPR